MKVNKYSDNNLIDILIEKSIELNKIPTIRDMKKPSGQLYINRFGTWNNALEQANLIKILDNEDSLKEKLIENIKLKFKELNKVPSKQDMKNPTGATYVKTFGSWNEAIIQSGFKPNHQGFEKEGLLYILREEFIKNNSTDMMIYERNRTSNVPCYRTIRRFFNKSWEDIITMTKEDRKHNYGLSNREVKIIRILQEWNIENNIKQVNSEWIYF